MGNDRILSSSDFDGQSGIPCISSAQKFVIPVPALSDGEPLVFPSGHEKAGDPIVDYKGNPIGETGVVFYNGTDRVSQAVPGDGQGIIIINQVTQEQAEKINNHIRESLGADPQNMTLPQIKSTLEFARSEGLVDQYNSNHEFMDSKFTGVKSEGRFGLFKRDDRDLCEAIVMDSYGQFQGPAAEPQPFSPGDVLLRQPDGKGGSSMRKIDREAFLQTYTSPSGE